MTPPRSLIVSIHDVSPQTFNEVQIMRGILSAWGIDRVSLLVVPDHHRQGRSCDHPELAEWLRHQEQAGDEIVLHGYYHQREKRSHEPPLVKLMTRSYTAGEGEFYDIDEAEARARLTRGLEEFALMGFRPAGFIAPAWLCSLSARKVLREMGFAYTTLLSSILDLRHHRTIQSQSCVWSTRAGWRRISSEGWNSWLSGRLRRNPVLRVGLHPPDFRYKRILDQIESLIARALRTRAPMTYLDFLSLVSPAEPARRD